MDRSFVIVQISDLHLDGSGRLLGTIEALTAAIREGMAAFSGLPDRILLITGDLVQEPTPRALGEALAVIAAFRQSGLFTDIQAVAGNRDLRRPGQRAGRHDAYDYLHLPRTSKSVYYRQAGLDLLLLDSNRACLTMSDGVAVDPSAYRATIADSARLSVELAGGLGGAGRADYAEPAENLVRVLALHHHPLPQATGEAKRFLGVPDEPLMYLAAPATFLEAATSLGVDLVLHGHRHVEGLTRYSIPDPRAARSEGQEAFWRMIYLLSCPSSTGQAGDDAGFNLIHFGPMLEADRAAHGFSVTRYSRPRDEATFGLLDSNLPQGIIRLRAQRDFARDPAVQAAIDMAPLTTLTPSEVAAMARRLLRRRAFYADGEADPADALFTYLITSLAWSELARKAARPERAPEAAALASATSLLARLIAQAADGLGLDRARLDELRKRPLVSRHDFCREMRRTLRARLDVAGDSQHRLETLRALDAQMTTLGLELGLGGRPAPDVPT
jgi:3',5'-cyclic-AMP phosphodiesterase